MTVPVIRCVNGGRKLTPCRRAGSKACRNTPANSRGVEMTRRGRKRRLVLEDEYWKLILGGVPTVAACRQIGIGRKTGYRWRAEAGGLPPARVAEETRSSRYLTLLERQRIATLREHGHGVREIARRIGRAPSTVSRELRRHLKPHGKGMYDADLAHARARDNARRERAGTLVVDPELRELVADKLEDTWSPQQISAWLRAEYPDRPEWHICHETIYQALYLGRKGGLSRVLTAKLAGRCASAAARPPNAPRASSLRRC